MKWVKGAKKGVKGAKKRELETVAFVWPFFASFFF
jgi:hypothetical protein